MFLDRQLATYIRPPLYVRSSLLSILDANTSALSTGEISPASDPESGKLWIKDGSQSGWTVGSCSAVKCELFLKGTTLSVSSDANPSDVHFDKIKLGKVVLFMSEENEDGISSFAEPGDSGAAVLSVNEDGTGFIFGGCVVSTFMSDIGAGKYDSTLRQHFLGASEPAFRADGGRYRGQVAGRMRFLSLSFFPLPIFLAVCFCLF